MTGNSCRPPSMRRLDGLVTVLMVFEAAFEKASRHCFASSGESFLMKSSWSAVYFSFASPEWRLPLFWTALLLSSAFGHR